jgi:hypothetical protein
MTGANQQTKCPALRHLICFGKTIETVCDVLGDRLCSWDGVTQAEYAAGANEVSSDVFVKKSNANASSG